MTTFTVGQEVTYKGAFGVNTIQSIVGNRAICHEHNTGRTFTKRISSLRAYVQVPAYWSEQELVQPIYAHGATVYATLSGDGNGSMMVWDDVKKVCVAPAELTKI